VASFLLITSFKSSRLPSLANIGRLASTLALEVVFSFKIHFASEIWYHSHKYLRAEIVSV
jgi:hypothetical protein